jgi:hypothetical protein
MLLLAVLGLGVSGCGSQGGSRSARWTSEEASRAIMNQAWSDQRIVVGSSCIGLDTAVVAGLDRASHYTCLTNFFARPTGISDRNWAALGIAFRSDNRARVLELLGLAPTATAAEVEAAAARLGLLTAQPETVGLRALASGASESEQPVTSAAGFNAWAETRHALLGAIPAIETYYADHQSYDGISVPTLLAIDTHVPDTLAIRETGSSSYCVELTSNSTTWHQRGPGGAPNLGPC